MAAKTMHAIVTGLVQGVGFRYFAARHAQAFGVQGFARNMADGSVEIEAQGDQVALDLFLGELRHGPRSSQVSRITVRWLDTATDYHHFEIR
jgi:acylphosphatase